MGSRRPSVVLILVIGVVAACSGVGGAAGTGQAGGGDGGGSTGTSVPAGGDLCGLLTPADWAAVGVSDASGPTENNDPPDAYFCVYKGKSSATGGYELDVFISPNASDAASTFPEMFGEYPSTSIEDVSVPGADRARIHLPTAEGGEDPALIGVQSGRLTFGIGMGSSVADAAQNEVRLKQLAALVLARGAALGK